MIEVLVVETLFESQVAFLVAFSFCTDPVINKLKWAYEKNKIIKVVWERELSENTPHSQPSSRDPPQSSF